MWISYSDSEVNKFHPVCEKALNRALKLLGKDRQYRVIHHQSTGTLEMDYCIQNIATGKYLCVIEVKRTPADVRSARYQFQAMSYVQMNAGETEKPFYILTNLEYAFAFRYDAARPKPFQQILSPGMAVIGSFKKDLEIGLIDKLTDYFKERLDEYCNDQYEYLVTLDQFAVHMEKIKADSRCWKTHLAVFLYEYIRGAFDFVNRNELRDIRAFHGDVGRICNEGGRINFKEIFTYSENAFEKIARVDNYTLVNIYDFGNQNVAGDLVSDILHQIVSAGHEHEGEVATDLELGRLVAKLAKYISGDLQDEELLCDPAAGSGSLLSSAIDTFAIDPKQILANDINPQFMELISLRLGLNFVRTIGHGNSPIITNENVVDLERSFFENVGVIVMNPPFAAGINCAYRKQEFYRRIHMLTGEEAETDFGQMPLEAVFLELITLLVVPGTTIACVFPKTHLMASGTEAQIIRKLVLTNLGLSVIFTYPGNEIFDSVMKDTCVLVGKAMQPEEYIDVVSSYEKIPDIDTHRFAQAMAQDFSEDFRSIMPGIAARKVSYNELKDTVCDGWRFLNSETLEAMLYVKEYFECSQLLIPLSEYEFPMKRGGAANSGGSDLMFFDSREELCNKFKHDRVVLKAGMRNAKLPSFVINGGDAKFLDVSVNDSNLVDRILDEYIKLSPRGGKQQRQEKSKKEWLEILKKESRGKFSYNSVLIPRNIRRNGKIYLSEEEVFVSTNFVVCTLPDYEKALMLATWMSTVFYQLICEVSSKDQEGARKMEVNDILPTFVPDLEKVSPDILPLLEKEKENLEFLDLQSPSIREVDKIWAKELFGERADAAVNEAGRLLEFLSNRRNTRTRN